MLPHEFSPFTETDDAVDPVRVHRLAEDTRIIFYADGTYGWTYVGSAEPERKSSIQDGAYYIVAAANKALYLKGVVNGTVLVYSPERIVIEGDLTYASYPNMAADSKAFLGIVCDKSVEVAGPDVTGPGDLLITASIYAKRSLSSGATARARPRHSRFMEA